MAGSAEPAYPFAAGQHGAMSMKKSLTGLLGEMLVAEGVIDENARVGTLSSHRYVKRHQADGYR
jgi:CubicO group peptidase (beta-lactamase class C family)